MEIAELFYSVTGEGFETLASNILSAVNGVNTLGDVLTQKVSKPLMDIAGHAIATTITFDKEMSRVSAVTGATGKDFDALEASAREMGRSTSKTATEAAQAMEFMGLAGWNLTEIQEGLEPVLRASEAGMMDLGLTSDLVTDSMAALGIGTQDLSRYLDIGAKAQNTSNQSLQQFLEAMNTAGGVFKMFNVPLEESAALLGILANRHYKGAEAGNALISIMNNLTTGTGQSGKAMKALGIEVYDLTTGKFRGISTILKDINEKFKGMTEEQKNTYIQMIGGKTRTKELTAMLNGAGDELDELTDKLKSSDGALNDMAKTMQGNLAGQLTRLKSGLEDIALSIGKRFIPYLEKAVSWVQKVVDNFSGLSDSTLDTIIVIGGIVAAIGPFLLAIGTLATGLAVAAGLLYALTTPIGLVVAGIGLLSGVVVAFAGAAGIGLLYTAMDKDFGKTLRASLDTLKSKLSELSGFINSNWKPAIEYLFTGNDMALDAIKSEAFKQSIVELKGTLDEFSSNVKIALGDVNKALKTIDTKDFEAASTKVSKGVKSLIGSLNNLISVYNKAKMVKLNWEIFIGTSGIATAEEKLRAEKAKLEKLEMEIEALTKEKKKYTREYEMATTVKGVSEAQAKLTEVNNKIDQKAKELTSAEKTYNKKHNIKVEATVDELEAKTKMKASDDDFERWVKIQLKGNKKIIVDGEVNDESLRNKINAHNDEITTKVNSGQISGTEKVNIDANVNSTQAIEKVTNANAGITNVANFAIPNILKSFGMDASVNTSSAVSKTNNANNRIKTASEKKVPNNTKYFSLYANVDTSSAVASVGSAINAIWWYADNITIPVIHKTATIVLDVVKKGWEALTGRATGGLVTESLTLVGERGPELVSLPYGSYVYTAQESQALMNKMTIPDSASFKNLNIGKPPNNITYNNETSQIDNSVYNVTIDAKNVKEFNDVIRVLRSAKKERNMRG